MSRRTLSSIVVCALLAVLFGIAAIVPVPYVTMSPGPTVDVLGASDGKEIVEISGRQAYPTEGTLRLTTVSVTSPAKQIRLAQALRAWFDDTRAVYPRDAIYPPQQSVQDAQRESSVQMVSSQDTAVAAALTELGYDLPRVVEILDVTPGAPAEGRLRVRDQILTVNGQRAGDAGEVSEAVQRTGVGESATFVVRRDGRTRRVEVPARAAEDDPDRAVVGITIGIGYVFPFDVAVREVRGASGEKIGGPSAGLVFALGVYDELTRGALTGGEQIAGTGTITDTGRVGPVGGVQQKIVAAADAGATLFLVPPDNCDSALAAGVPEEEIRLVKAPTLHSAIRSLEAYAADRDAELPGCG